MQNDQRIIELLTDMVIKLDKLDTLVEEMREVKQEMREVKQAVVRQEALFARHLQTTEAQQNTQILDLQRRVEVLEKKAA